MVEKNLENFKLFLNNAQNKSWVNPNTIRNWNIALKKYEAVLDDAEKEDLMKIKPDNLFTRFTNFYHSDGISGASFKTYRTRFTGALSNFLKYANNPAEYNPPAANGGKLPKAKQNSSKADEKKDLPKQKSISNIEPISAPIENITSPYVNFEIYIPGINYPAKFLIPKELKKEAHWTALNNMLATYLDGLQQLQAEEKI